MKTLKTQMTILLALSFTPALASNSTKYLCHGDNQSIHIENYHSKNTLKISGYINENFVSYKMLLLTPELETIPYGCSPIYNHTYSVSNSTTYGSFMISKAFSKPHTRCAGMGFNVASLKIQSTNIEKEFSGTFDCKLLK